MNETIGFIGAGNMSSSIAGGLLNQGWPTERILLSCRDCSRHGELSGRGLRLLTNNRTLVEQADIIVLATKPQQAQDALAQCGEGLAHTCLISIVAGLPIALLSRWAGAQCSIIRAMPNTPALLRQGITGIYADSTVREEFGHLCELIFDAVGRHVWVAEEKLIDTVTATSGSGPAYFFRFVEDMIAAACEQGLTAETAQALVIQTIVGASSLLMSSGQTPAELRRSVTSPGGTTAAALAIFEQGQLTEIVARAMAAARDRATTLARENSH